MAGILWEKVFKQYRGLATDEERVKDLVPQLEVKLDGYETILSKQKYLAGNVRFSFPLKRVQRNRRSDAAALYRRSLSQIYSICPIAPSSLSSLDSEVWTSVPISKGKRYPFRVWQFISANKSYRWWNDISSRPSWQSVKNGA